MLCLFHPLQEYVGTSILTVGALHFFTLLGCMLKFSLECVYLPFVPTAESINQNKEDPHELLYGMHCVVCLSVCVCLCARACVKPDLGAMNYELLLFTEIKHSLVAIRCFHFNSLKHYRSFLTCNTHVP